MGIKEILKGIYLNQDIRTIIYFLGYTLVWGFITSFSMAVLFGFMFNLYSIVGWGFLFWILEKKIVTLLRSVIHK